MKRSYPPTNTTNPKISRRNGKRDLADMYMILKTALEHTTAVEPFFGTLDYHSQMELRWNQIAIKTTMNWIRFRISGHDPSKTSIKDILLMAKQFMLKTVDEKGGHNKQEKVEAIEKLFDSIFSI